MKRFLCCNVKDEIIKDIACVNDKNYKKYIDKYDDRVSGFTPTIIADINYNNKTCMIYSPKLLLYILNIDFQKPFDNLEIFLIIDKNYNYKCILDNDIESVLNKYKKCTVINLNDLEFKVMINKKIFSNILKNLKLLKV